LDLTFCFLHGTDKLQIKLREEGGIRALLGMVRSRHPDVLAQVARGIANFAKCESRGAAQGIKWFSFCKVYDPSCILFFKR
jgi:hypothetical protein